MGTFNLLPQTEYSNEGWVIVGASTLASAWDNDTDTIYAKCPGSKGRGEVTFPIDTSSVPEGAVITSISVFLRCAKTAGNPSITINVVASDDEAKFEPRTFYPTSTITTFEVATLSVDPTRQKWDVHRLNHLRCRVFSWSAIADAIRCHKFYCRVNFKYRPTTTVTDPTGTVRTPSPSIAWTYSQVDADQLAKTEYQVFTTLQTQAASFSPDSAPPTYAATVTGDVRSQQLPTSLNPDSYTVFVRTYSVYGAKSLWASRAFEIQGPSPAVPGNDNANVSDVPGVGTVAVVPDSYGSAVFLTIRDASNLLSVQQADGEVATDPLEVVNQSGLSITRETVNVYTPGVGSFKLTNTVAGTMVAATTYNEISPGIPITIVGQIRSAVTARSTTLGIEFFDSDFTSLGAPSITSTVTDSATTWKELKATGVTPAGAAWFKLLVTVTSAALSEIHYADRLGVMFGLGSAWSHGGHASRNLLTSFQATADDPANGVTPADPFVANNNASSYAIVGGYGGTGNNGGKCHKMTFNGLTPTIAFRATSTSFTSPTSGNDFTLNKPTGLADNDLMVAYVTTTTPSTITPPVGWDLVNSVSAESNNGLYILKRTGLAADPSTWAGTFASNSSRRSAVVVAYSGAAAASEQFVAEKVRSDPDGAPVHTTASINNTVTNSWRIAAFVARDDAGSGSFTANTSPPTVAPAAVYVGKATKWSRNSTSNTFTINRPAGVQSGDLMVASVISNGSVTANTLTGWTLVDRTVQTDHGDSVTMFVYKRTAGGSEPSSWSSTFTTSNTPCLTQAVAYRNVKDASLQFAAGWEDTNTDDSGTALTTPIVNNTSSNSLRINIFGALTPFAGTWTSSEAYERCDDYQTSVNDVALAIYDSGVPISTGNTYQVGYSTQSYYGAIAWIGLIAGLDTPASGTSETERRDVTTGSADPWVTMGIYDSNGTVASGPTTLTGTFANSTPTSVISWIGLIKPASLVISGDVAARMTDMIDLSNLDPNVRTLAGNKITVAGSFLGSAPGTPYIGLDFYRANQWLSSVTAEGTAYGTATWSKSHATFDLPEDCTRVRMFVSSRERAATDTVGFDRLSISLGESAVWRNGTSRDEHPVWSHPEFQYADDDGSGYSEWKTLPGVALDPPEYDQATGIVVFADHTVVPLHSRKYRAQTVSYGLNGDRFVSGWGPESDEVNLTASNWWLKDVSDSSQNLLLIVKSEPTNVTTVGTATAFYPMGADEASVVGDGYKGDKFSLVVQTYTSEQYSALNKLVKSNRTLLLQSDVDHAWWIRVVGDIQSSIQVTGRRSERPLRFVTINYVEVSPEE